MARTHRQALGAAPLLAAALAAAGCGGGNSAARPAVPGAMRELVFFGMCDASGAVPLAGNRFAVADDEGNVLRVYDADRGGAPLLSVDVSYGLDLPEKAKKKPKKPKKRKPDKPPKARKPPEVDIEAATRVGDLAYWLTSHARSSSGKLKEERHRFFATTLPHEGAELRVIGIAYDALFSRLAADPRFAPFGLTAAAARGPKDPGGVNIEGLTATLDGGGVLIGFRNPIPDGRALIVPLLNPEQLLAGAEPSFGDPIALPLGGLGVRSLSSWRGRYLIAAGHYDSGAASQLYLWDGAGPPVQVRAIDFRNFNPEAFVTPDERDEILVLSDDGSVAIDGRECKKAKDPAAKRFRGVWLRLTGTGTGTGTGAGTGTGTGTGTGSRVFGGHARAGGAFATKGAFARCDRSIDGQGHGHGHVHGHVHVHGTGPGVSGAASR